MENESIITWHDPEKERPETMTYYLITVFLSGAIVWQKAYWDGMWWDATDNSNISGVIRFGEFELPGLEVKG